MARRKRLPDGASCYACEAPATTWEHAPPQAFYPTHAEVGPIEASKNYRTGLIRVPSCARHNNGKSKEDNYGVAVIAVLTAAQVLAEDEGTPIPPFFERSIEHARRGYRLRHTFDSLQPLTVVDPKGERGGTIQIEAHAIDGMVESAARALYYHHHHHRKRWPGACRVRNLHTLHADLSRPQDDEAFRRIEALFVALERDAHPVGRRLGPHPDIFFYQFTESEDRVAMRLVFYQLFRFIAVAKPARETQT